jgi:hypothetical protein
MLSMPFYEAGDHKVDHPPLFACREHKQFLRLRASFIDEMLKTLEDQLPSNLHEIAAPYVNGDTNAFRLPEYLIPPRVLIYNPEGLRGAQALPFTLVFIDKRFIGIPAAYLTADRFEGCVECPEAPPTPIRVQKKSSAPTPRQPASPSQKSSGSVPSVRASGAPPAAQTPKRPLPASGSGPIPQQRPAGAPPPAKRPAGPPAAPPPRPPQR